MTTAASIESKYDLVGVCRVITTYDFSIIVLQFPDENLADAVDVYGYINSRVPRSGRDIYITADSTFGSSVDDVSALHVNCDLLVHFGHDMSVSGSMPVIVCPRQMHIDVADAVDKIYAELPDNSSLRSVSLFFDPAIFHKFDDLCAALGARLSVPVEFGRIPPCAQLSSWSPEGSRVDLVAEYELIGGMLVARDMKRDEGSVIVIGDKSDQIVNICLRYSAVDVICYSPSAKTVSRRVGSAMKEYRERYVGVMKVKDAAVIGIIVGSMGLSGDIIRHTLSEIQALIAAAGKKSYTFVMGRINEAKLRNFPEVDNCFSCIECMDMLTRFLSSFQVDVFCLLSNDDTALISPK